MATALLAPCFSCGLTSCLASCCASCALNALCSACCSIAGCFCPRNSRVAKVFYLLLFLAAAIAGIALRYKGEEAISGWVAVVKTCADDGSGASACYGLQAAYRVSASVCGFFVILAISSFCFPIVHYGAWLLKLLFFILMLGLSLLIPNHFFNGYAELSRYGSIIFLLIQVLLIIDFAYAVHEWLLRKMAETDARFEAEGFEPGLCNNGWKLLYVATSLALGCGSVVGIGVMFKFFGQCSLMQFFLSETLIMGLILLVASVWGANSHGMMPPCLLFAYNTYLCYGALSNNPDGACNLLAAGNAQNEASIIAGLAVACISITWAAFSSAGGLVKAVAAPAGTATKGSSSPAAAAAPVLSPPARQSSDLELAPVAANPHAATPSSAASPLPSSGAEKSATAVSAAAYASDDSPGASTGATKSAAQGAPEAGAGGCCDSGASAGPAEALEPKAWVFHLTMAFAGLYLAMLVTNWGDASKAAAQNGNPELSVASMWVRIVTQWLIYIVFGWTLIAPHCGPVCCPGRDFS